MLSVTINKIMQKLPLIGVPWNLQFVIFKKIIYKVLEKNSCEISIEDYVYFLVLSNVWSEICETYWKIQSWKKMWQPLQPPPFPPLQCWVDLVSFRPPRSTILIYHWKGGWGQYSRKCTINFIFRLYFPGNNPC